MVKATNGTLIQTTITVATKKKDAGSSSQEWPWKSPPRRVSSQLMTPYWVSKSHCHTVSAATTGIAQASSSALCTIRRTGFDIWRISSATATPMNMVMTALARQKATDRGPPRSTGRGP